MKGDYSQTGRESRARQQGFNIMEQSQVDSKSKAGWPDDVQPTTLWLRHESEARTRKATRFVRVARDD